ncbi:alkaline shock response membrane anchor protein AmaP [Streptomyces sp. MUM 203J]|uniref:alkaline shock response membrane anchor protein AmaP n=1 Tax=Streptomyces sp. MUM 203J TaxID=2791990 RepID=UPI001F039C52|nr:alkaline shock response membrane anchor protein AmaP [Streptomyces sp. MUM 203J]
MPSGNPVPPADRGATTLTDRAVARIATQAAREALRTAPAPGQARRPQASAVVHRDSARVRVVLELAYPTDLGAQCAAVRRQVVRRIESLTGLAVPEAAVHVERLHPTHAGLGETAHGVTG